MRRPRVSVYQSNSRELDATFFGDVVRAVEHNYPTPVPAEAARADARNCLPAGTQLVETYRFSLRDVDGSVDLHLSQSLPTRLFPAAGRREDIWLAGRPGGNSVICRTQAGGAAATVSVEAGKRFSTGR